MNHRELGALQLLDAISEGRPLPPAPGRSSDPTDLRGVLASQGVDPWVIEVASSRPGRARAAATALREVPTLQHLLLPTLLLGGYLGLLFAAQAMTLTLLLLKVEPVLEAVSRDFRVPAGAQIGADLLAPARVVAVLAFAALALAMSAGLSGDSRGGLFGSVGRPLARARACLAGASLLDPEETLAQLPRSLAGALDWLQGGNTVTGAELRELAARQLDLAERRAQRLEVGLKTGGALVAVLIALCALSATLFRLLYLGAP